MERDTEMDKINAIRDELNKNKNGYHGFSSKELHLKLKKIDPTLLDLVGPGIEVEEPFLSSI